MGNRDWGRLIRDNRDANNLPDVRNPQAELVKLNEQLKALEDQVEMGGGRWTQQDNELRDDINSRIAKLTEQ